MPLNPTSELRIDPEPPNDPAGGGTTAQPAADDAAGGDDDVARLKRALQAEREQRRQEEANRKSLEAQLREVGTVDPKLLEDARARAREAEQQRQLIEQQTALRIQEQERKYQEQLGKVTADLQAAKTAAEREALRIKTEREFLRAKGATDASPVDGRTPFDYIWQLYGPQFAEDRSGIYLVDGDGMPQLDPETGKRITPTEFFTKLRKDPVHGMHFQPEYGSGSGARAGRDGRVVHSRDVQALSKNELFAEAFARKGAA